MFTQTQKWSEGQLITVPLQRYLYGNTIELPYHQKNPPNSFCSFIDLGNTKRTLQGPLFLGSDQHDFVELKMVKV